MFDVRPCLLLLFLSSIASLPAHAGPAQAAAQPAAAAPNCGLAQPPLDAGFDRHMGALLRVYPRNPDIGPAYAGCQTLWMEDGDGWQVVTVVHYERGRVSRVESPAGDMGPLERCLLKDGAVIKGDPALCADLDGMRFESRPAACLAGSGAASAPPPRCALE
jgi:hypothetical protein